ncbi:MAG: cell envelope integrity protein CreD [Treponema sp.]|jgi:inner membrane protein|nr:cell envelope integrity protein CreD [Treponema sp.]
MTIGRITQSSGFKVFLLTILVLFFLIPVGMIQDIIWERRHRAQEAEEVIMDSWGSEFLVMGPALRIPGRQREEIKKKNEKGEEQIEIRESVFNLWLVPATLDVDINLETETKKRGIFSIPLFSGSVQFTGNFDLHRTLEELNKNQEIFPEKAELVISLAGQRGIRGVEKAEWNNSALYLLPGNEGFSTNIGKGGIHSAAPVLVDGKNTFDISLNVQGGKTVRMVPLGEESKFTMRTDWTAPSFQGSYLPVSHSINDAGFEAQWEISHLSRSIPLSWQQHNTDDFELDSVYFSVDFFNALNQYNLNTRAVKYALLFIIIPFLSLFILELLLRREIHPVQYLLAGIGNVVFYLLLLSFSEHLPFPPAYWISASAVTAMMSLYSRTLLGAWTKSVFMAFVMLFCYTFLYFTLQSEDWALLFGSIGVFGITALVMFFTRKLDWYGKDRKPVYLNSLKSKEINAEINPDENTGAVDSGDIKEF